MKVAIIHYWLLSMRGGEKVIESIIDLYPDVDIYTHVYDPSRISDKINKQRIYTTFINKIPLSKKIYKYLLPLMPHALKLLNLNKYDLIISNESGPTKGIIKRKDAVHICYCLSPMRYIWDMSNTYLKKLSFTKRIIAKITFSYLRKWDIKTSKSIDEIAVISNFVKMRVKKYWNRESKVIFPPVIIESFNINDEIGDYYLVLSQLVYYKRIDIAVNAFNKINKKLIVIGEGEELEILKHKAKDNIRFIGWQNEENKRKYLSACKALIFPGIEDFGIVPIETMASGRPVIAFKGGGALDYIKNDINGIFFHSQTSESLFESIIYFEKNIHLFNSKIIKESISKFSDSRFKERIKEFIDRSLLNND